MSFSVGDRCRDGNRNCPNYGKTGTVVSVQGNNLTWKSDDGQIITDPIKDMEKIMHKGRRHKQQGGLLVGPSHEEGGIGAVISGGEEVELEGGEYIVNAQTVDALGTEFLDKLNSTQTSYHTGGFGQGQLPSPSQYARGGKIRRNNMRKRRFHTGGQLPYELGKRGNPYRKGGRVRSKRRFQVGGHTHSFPHNHSSWNPQNQQYWPTTLPNQDPLGTSWSAGAHSHPSSINSRRMATGITGTDTGAVPYPPRPRRMARGGMLSMNRTQACPPGCERALDGGCNCWGPDKPKPIPIKQRRGGRVMRRSGGRVNRRKFHSGGKPHPHWRNDHTHNPYSNIYRTGGGVYTGSPNSCVDGNGNNVPC